MKFGEFGVLILNDTIVCLIIFASIAKLLEFTMGVGIECHAQHSTLIRQRNRQDMYLVSLLTN